MEEVITSYYLRTRVQDRPGVLADKIATARRSHGC